MAETIGDETSGVANGSCFKLHSILKNAEVGRTSNQRQSLRPDLQKHIGFDGDLSAERPVVAGDQQHGYGHPGCKDPHRDRGTGAIVAVNNGDRGQRTTGLREQSQPLDPIHA